jgi:CRISPR/Cas system CMR subunit Cmr4 (Cas7 group RAMP superfamily)
MRVKAMPVTRNDEMDFPIISGEQLKGKSEGSGLHSTENAT